MSKAIVIREAVTIEDGMWRQVSPYLDQINEEPLSDHARITLLKVILHKLPTNKAYSVLNALFIRGCFGDYEFEVEAILGESVGPPHVYRVKWTSWPDEFCSWEPYQNIKHCFDEFEAYMKWTLGHASDPFVESSHSSPRGLHSLDALVDSMCSNCTDIKRQLTFDVIKTTIEDILSANSSRGKGAQKIEKALSKIYLGPVNEPIGKKQVTVKPPILFPTLPSVADDMSSCSASTSCPASVSLSACGGDSLIPNMPELKDKRERKLFVQCASLLQSDEFCHGLAQKEHARRLKVWEDELNKIWGRNFHIIVENDVDMEASPQNYEPINDYVYAPNIAGNMEPPPIFCSCQQGECHQKRYKDCCVSFHGVPYTKAGLLSDKHNSNVIYECNSRCSCGPACPYRIVQKGYYHYLTIFRTRNRGWGVRSRRRILRGKFICEYIGEVITFEEAESRGLNDDKDGATYLFDLDCDGDPHFSVDARYKSNVARFINHSCDPNCVTMSVFIDNLNPKLARLALFAKRDIDVDEELSFDYLMSCDTGDNTTREELSQSMSSRQVRRDCACEARNCRGFIYM